MLTKLTNQPATPLSSLHSRLASKPSTTHLFRPQRSWPKTQTFLRSSWCSVSQRSWNHSDRTKGISHKNFNLFLSFPTSKPEPTLFLKQKRRLIWRRSRWWTCIKPTNRPDCMHCQWMNKTRDLSWRWWDWKDDVCQGTVDLPHLACDHHHHQTDLAPSTFFFALYYYSVTWRESLRKSTLVNAFLSF